MSDVPLIPLHFEVTPWALKKGITYKPRIDQYTLATEVRPASLDVSFRIPDPPQTPHPESL